jgi:hypothetical protein
VEVFGGDGRMHAVPVPWTEYIPVSRNSNVVIKAHDKLGVSGLASLSSNNDWRTFLAQNASAAAFRQAVMAFASSSVLADAALDHLGAIIDNSLK